MCNYNRGVKCKFLAAYLDQQKNLKFCSCVGIELAENPITNFSICMD